MELGAGVLRSVRLLAVGGLAVGCGLEAVPLCCDRLAVVLCAVALACWLWPVVGCAAVAYGLEAVPLVGAVLVRLSACALVGAMGGVYIKLPGDYTGRVKPLPARRQQHARARFKLNAPARESTRACARIKTRPRA